MLFKPTRFSVSALILSLSLLTPGCSRQPSAATENVGASLQMSNANGTATTLPAIDIYLSFAGLGWLVDDLSTTFSAIPQLTFADSDTAHTVTANISLPEPWDYYQPIIQHDKTTQQLIIASSQSFLQKCLTADSAIQTDPHFKQASANLATEGIRFQYMSPEVDKAISAIYENIATDDEDTTALITNQFHRA